FFDERGPQRRLGIGGLLPFEFHFPNIGSYVIPIVNFQNLVRSPKVPPGAEEQDDQKQMVQWMPTESRACGVTYSEEPTRQTG
ncbi:hypothetical protein, partial [Escherichia coli]|uniref:hypothetical protein n=1 Tax=Escherichia coli TaxID=562 RepID=UPI001BC8C373